MNRLKPSDLDNFSTLESCRKIKIDQLINKANEELRNQIVLDSLRLENLFISLTTTRTRFGGRKYWFLCPMCAKRAGVIYTNPQGKVSCRRCMGLLYLGQKFRKVKGS